MYLRILTWCALISSAVAQAQVPGQRGSICGSFLDENGHPSAHTEVTAIYIGPHTGGYPVSRTDAFGHYCIMGVDFGEYAVSALDERKGYPALYSEFYAPHSPEPHVTLSAANPNGRVDGRIPYKAGFLSIRLTDAQTGKPIPSMSVSLILRSDPDHRWMRISTSSDQVLLIPPNEDVYVNVTSPGFSTWPSDGSKGLLLSFLPGQKQVITVSIRKAEN